MEDPARTQDILGQLPILKAYNHILLGFALSEDTSRESVVQALSAAALQLTTSIPWIGGKVVNVGSGPGNTGLFRSVPCELFAPPNSILRVKDATADYPSYDEIMSAKGPISMLDGSIIAPKPAFPVSYVDSESDPAPALLIQATFLKGGVLLDFAAQHNLSDGGGVIQMINLFATTLRGEKTPEKAIVQANRDRRDVIRLLDPAEPMLDHSHLVRPPPSTIPANPVVSPDNFIWQYFRFSASTLGALKDIASSPADFDPSVKFISTDDALCAFLWQRIATVRLRRRQTPDDLCKMTRAVDIRRTLNVPSEYMGVMVYNVSGRLPLGQLVTASLARAASELRKALNSIDEYAVRSFATFVARQPDKSTLAYAGKFNPDVDMGVSSMASVPLYRANFGPLGAPGLVRRPNFAPVMSTIYVMPQTVKGDVDVLICLTREDIGALREDPEWTAYAEYIG
uniref:Trichothecene 3-O-acetyltransferase n=1 Tax=Monascus pilosus TaxID=89488 RepID=R9UMI5_MONPI|nr:trichothecene 3-O-acetyltransferase [Monascus pilosus]